MKIDALKDPERPRSAASGAPFLRLLVWAALAIPLAGGPFQDARAGCRELAMPLRDALQARDLDAARNRYEAMQKDLTCSGADLKRAGRAVSNLHVMVAEERMAGGASLASQHDLLKLGNVYARTWDILTYLGDIAYDARDYDHATGLYQEALMVLNNEEETPKRPPDSEIKRIVELAGLNRMLARNFAEAPTNRTGMLDGLAAPSFRGFVPERVPLPITFRTNSGEFDKMGRRYVEEMAEFLHQQKPDSITISAHTDERGKEAHNFSLSKQRGEAVRDFLRDRGFKGDITVNAKGESQPYSPPGQHSQKEIWRLNRRVELIRW